MYGSLFLCPGCAYHHRKKFLPIKFFNFCFLNGRFFQNAYTLITCFHPYLRNQSLNLNPRVANTGWVMWGAWDTAVSKLENMFPLHRLCMAGQMTDNIDRWHSFEVSVTIIYLFIGGHASQQCFCGGQKTACRGSPSTMWVLWLKLGL